MTNLPDKIYQEFVEEVEALELPGSMPAAAVVGQLTRALKRVTNQYGGTAYTENGIKYDINNKEIPSDE